MWGTSSPLQTGNPLHDISVGVPLLYRSPLPFYLGWVHSRLSPHGFLTGVGPSNCKQCCVVKKPMTTGPQGDLAVIAYCRPSPDRHPECSRTRGADVPREGLGGSLAEGAAAPALATGVESFKGRRLSGLRRPSHSLWPPVQGRLCAGTEPGQAALRCSEVRGASSQVPESPPSRRSWQAWVASRPGSPQRAGEGGSSRARGAACGPHACRART